jgi:hypothetical protein
MPNSLMIWEGSNMDTKDAKSVERLILKIHKFFEKQLKKKKK